MVQVESFPKTMEATLLRGIRKKKILPRIATQHIQKRRNASSDSGELTKETWTDATFHFSKNIKNLCSYLKEHLPETTLKELLKEYSDVIQYADASLYGLESGINSENMLLSLENSSSIMAQRILKKKMKYNTLFGKNNTESYAKALQKLSTKRTHFAQLMGAALAASMAGQVLFSHLSSEDSCQNSSKSSREKLYKQIIDTGGNILTQGTIRKTTPLIKAGQNTESLTELGQNMTRSTLQTVLEYSLLRAALLVFTHCGNYQFSKNPFSNNQCSIDNIQNDFDYTQEAKKLALSASFAATIVCCAFLFKKIKHNPQNKNKKT